MLEADPGDKSGAEGEIEEPFIGDGEDDEDRREGEKNDHKSMEVVIVRVKTV